MSKRTTCISTSKQSVARKVIYNITTMNVTRSLQSAARANVKVAANMFKPCLNLTILAEFSSSRMYTSCTPAALAREVFMRAMFPRVLLKHGGAQSLGQGELLAARLQSALLQLALQLVEAPAAQAAGVHGVEVSGHRSALRHKL